ncbi:MAG: hypothetical protein DWQ01_18630 [Planctomycetota bacterium]|nr:MAG: hypothetical protein DWQ01_18630 [Planctomycetota bacterium]
MLIGLALAVLGFFQQVESKGGEWKEAFRATGVGFFEEFGKSLDSCNDLDGDGVSEIIAGTLQANRNGLFGNGLVQVLSGKDGNLIFEFVGQQQEGRLGVDVGAADVNGDGLQDIIAGAFRESPGGNQEGSVYVYSGADGQIIYRLDGIEAFESFGERVGGLGDLDLDGCEDFYIQSSKRDTFFPDRGSAIVYSGKDGTIMYELGGTWSWPGGDGACLNGDIDGDGYQDFALVSLRLGGAVTVYSGLTGNEIYFIEGPPPNGSMGGSLDAIGDLNQDGVDEFIAGAPGARESLHGGMAYVYSGRTGETLFVLRGEEPYAAFGLSVAGVGDTDGDGYQDFLVSDPILHFGGGNLTGGVYLFSGLDGKALARIVGDGNELACLGMQVVGIGDSNENGLSDFVASSPCGLVPTNNVGTVVAFSFEPFLKPDARELSASQGGQITFTLDFSAEEAGKDYQLLASSTQRGRSGPGNAIPLAQSPILDRMFSQPPAIFTNATGTLDAAGDAVATMTLAPNQASSAIGLTFRFSAVSWESPTEVSAASATVEVEILP